MADDRKLDTNVIEELPSHTPGTRGEDVKKEEGTEPGRYDGEELMRIVLPAIQLPEMRQVLIHKIRLIRKSETDTCIVRKANPF